MSNKKINDSAKLRFTYGIIFLIISYVLLVGIVSSIWLTVIVREDFLFLAMLLLLLFAITIIAYITKFIEACQHIE